MLTHEEVMERLRKAGNPAYTENDMNLIAQDLSTRSNQDFAEKFLQAIEKHSSEASK